MARVKRLDLVPFVAAGLCIVALGSAILWLGSDSTWVDSLAPNVITESLGIAVAVTVIAAVLRRRDRLRVQPLVDYALDTVRLGFLNFVTSLVLDYSMSHVYPEVLPRNALQFVDHWLAQQSAENCQRQVFAGQRFTTPVGAALEFAESAFRTIDTNRHDIPVDLVRASQAMATSVSLSATLLDTIGDSTPAKDRADAEGTARRSAVTAIGNFVRELERVDSRVTALDVPDFALSAGNTLRRQALFGPAASGASA